jgi:hypothetical protein
MAVVVSACGGGASPSVSNAAAIAASSSPSAPASSDQSPSADAPSDSPADTPSDSPAEPTAPTVDPCALITVAEANAVTGVKTLPPEAAGDPPSRCVWATPTSGAIGQVEIDVGDGAKKTYDIDLTVLKHKFTPVAGLGDEGYAEDGTVFFRQGDTWVAIHIVRLDDSKLWMPKLIALAKTVATRV